MFNGFVNGHPTLLSRWMPSNTTDAEIGETWVGVTVDGGTLVGDTSNPAV